MQIHCIRKSDKEVTMIETDNTPNREHDYLKLSGKPFVETVEESETIDDNDTDIEVARQAYKDKFGKDVAVTYKNNLARIQSKLNG